MEVEGCNFRSFSILDLMAKIDHMVIGGHVPSLCNLNKIST